MDGSKASQFGEQNTECAYEDDDMFTKMFSVENGHDVSHAYNEIITRNAGNTSREAEQISNSYSKETTEVEKSREMEPSNGLSNYSTTSQPRQKGARWTEEEHKLFLMGLEMYGKGDWINISRFYVVTKTPCQVASHGQKYFRRLKCTTPLEKRRYSIHDIRMVNSTIVEIPSRPIDLTYPGEPSNVMKINEDPFFYNSNNTTTQFWAYPNYMNF